MTNREFYTAVANGTINEEIVAHASAAIEKLDAANEARKNKPSKTAEANAPIKEALANALAAEAVLTAELAAVVGVSAPKASALLRQLVAEGVAVQTEVSVPKKGKQKAYALAPSNEA